MDCGGSPLIIADMPPRMPCCGCRAQDYVAFFRAQALESVFTREDELSIPQSGVHVLSLSVSGCSGAR